MQEELDSEQLHNTDQDDKAMAPHLHRKHRQIRKLTGPFVVTSPVAIAIEPDSKDAQKSAHANNAAGAQTSETLAFSKWDQSKTQSDKGLPPHLRHRLRFQQGPTESGVVADSTATKGGQNGVKTVVADLARTVGSKDGGWLPPHKRPYHSSTPKPDKAKAPVAPQQVQATPGPPQSNSSNSYPTNGTKASRSVLATKSTNASTFNATKVCAAPMPEVPQAPEANVTSPTIKTLHIDGPQVQALQKEDPQIAPRNNQSGCGKSRRDERRCTKDLNTKHPGIGHSSHIGKNNHGATDNTAQSSHLSPKDPVQVKQNTSNKRNGWLRNRDVPKGDAECWNLSWSEHLTSSAASWAAAGWGDQVKQGATEWQLADFSGKWAPVPMNWDNRPHFRNADAVPGICSWLGSLDTKLDDHECPVADQVTSDPRDELDGVAIPISQPDEKGINPAEESQAQLQARMNDGGSWVHALKWQQAELQRKKAIRSAKRQQRRTDIKQLASSIPPDRGRIKTSLSLYIRGAKSEDVTQICGIYNWYVHNSCAAPEIEPRRVDHMRRRLDAVRSKEFPYVVAVQREPLTPSIGNSKVCAQQISRCEDKEKIVGFAFADDFNNMTGMFRYTAALEMYVHHEYCGKSVGKCLLDRMVSLLDKGYIPKGGYDVVGDDMRGVGVNRFLTNLTISLPFDDSDRLDRLSRWFYDLVEFKKAGVLDGIGNKGNKAVGLAMFTRATSTFIDHSKPPYVPQYPLQGTAIP